jgi:hypothetical protein
MAVCGEEVAEQKVCGEEVAEQKDNHKRRPTYSFRQEVEAPQRGPSSAQQK